mmetsp:Transcript_10658/g.15492  ORF Transcript_10658/g.15492 Transcript_10658/m.15492 type:complete len:166 (-) Transcript_10658:1091-1588(-)
MPDEQSKTSTGVRTPAMLFLHVVWALFPCVIQMSNAFVVSPRTARVPFSSPSIALRVVPDGDDVSSLERRREEIEAMGGDSFFFSEEHDDVSSETDVSNDDDSHMPSMSLLSNAAALDVASGGDAVERFATDGLGPAPKQKESTNSYWDGLWDGTVDEEAHLGLD